MLGLGPGGRGDTETDGKEKRVEDVPGESTDDPCERTEKRGVAIADRICIELVGWEEDRKDTKRHTWLLCSPLCHHRPWRHASSSTEPTLSHDPLIVNPSNIYSEHMQPPIPIRDLHKMRRAYSTKRSPNRRGPRGTSTATASAPSQWV